jgi:hypothetical protein
MTGHALKMAVLSCSHHSHSHSGGVRVSGTTRISGGRQEDGNAGSCQEAGQVYGGRDGYDDPVGFRGRAHRHIVVSAGTFEGRGGHGSVAVCGFCFSSRCFSGDRRTLDGAPGNPRSIPDSPASTLARLQAFSCTETGNTAPPKSLWANSTPKPEYATGPERRWTVNT